MLNLNLSIFLIFFSVFLKTRLALASPVLLLKNMNCSELKTKSTDKTYVLNQLAAIRASKLCENTQFNWGQTSEIEKKILQIEFEPKLVLKEQEQSEIEKANLENLKESIVTETDFFKKFQLLKKLQLKYKSLGQKFESQKTTNDIYDLTLTEYKQNKKNKLIQESHLEASVLLARQIWNNHQHKEADKLLNSISRRLKGQILLADIYYLRAKISDELNKFKIAQKFYDLTLQDLAKEDLKASSILQLNTEKVLWQKAWSLYRNKNWSKAYKSLDQLAELTEDSAEKSRALFFASRCLRKLKKIKKADLILSTLPEEDFYSFYALLSYHERGQKLPALNSYKSIAEPFSVSSQFDFLNERNNLFFKALVENQEAELAERSIYHYTSDTENALQLSIYLAEKLQSYLSVFTYFSKLDNVQKINFLMHNNYQLAKLVYPKLYEKKVLSMSQKTQVPSSFIYSIIKQESAFNPMIVSPAQAYGLMQLIKSTAEKLAKKNGLSFKDVIDLYNPDLNIELGTYELSEQIAEHKNYAFVTAAYNAGPTALKRWVKSRWKKHFDLVDFIEDIPYDETRLYIKIAARNFLFYERLEKPSSEIEFPSQFVTK